MFESIVVRRTNPQGISVATLAETLLFYDNVQIHLDRGSLFTLLQSIGKDGLLALIGNGFAKITFQKDGVYTRSFADGSSRFVVDALKVGVQRANGKLRAESDQEVVETVFARALGASWSTRRAAKRFLDAVPIRSLNKFEGHPDGVVGIAMADLADEEYVRCVAAETLGNHAPGFIVPDNFEFRIVPVGDGSFFVLTDLDFGQINKGRSDQDGMLSPSLLVSPVLEARAEIMIAAERMSELVVSPEISKVASLRFGTMLAKRGRNSDEIALFQNLELNGAHAVGDAVESGERSFSEFLKLLERSARFKEWLKGTHPEERLIAEYHRASTQDTWAERLPFKTLRWAMFTGVGIAADAYAGAGGLGTFVGQAVSAVDAFLVDKVVKGWRPHHFVATSLKDFVSGTRR